MNGADNLLGSRIDRLEGLSVNTLDPFVVDEPGRDALLDKILIMNPPEWQGIVNGELTILWVECTCQ